MKDVRKEVVSLYVPGPPNPGWAMPVAETLEEGRAWRRLRGGGRPSDPKRCPRCGRDKPRVEFAAGGSCRPCANDHIRERRRNRIEGRTGTSWSRCPGCGATPPGHFVWCVGAG